MRLFAILKNLFTNGVNLLSKIQKIPTILLLLILNFIVFSRWILIPILTYGDWSFHFFNSTSSWFLLPQIWSVQQNLGGVNFSISSWIIYFIYGALGQFHLNSNVGDKIIFMYPIIIFSITSSYILVRKIVSSSLAAAVGAIVYCYSTYFLLITGGVLTLAAAYAIAPFVLYFFIRTLEEKKIILGIVSGLLATIMSMYEFREFYMLLWVCFIYFWYHIFIVDRKNKFRSVLLGIIPILIVAALNSYWIIGLARVNVLVSNVFFNRGLFGGSFVNVNFAMTLFHSFWGSKPGEYFVVHPIPTYVWIIPLSAIMGFFLNRRNKKIFFFGIISLLGIFLTKQTAPPFPDVYPYLYSHLPGFNAFREASKFFFLIALGYSVLIAGFIDFLCKNWTRSKVKTFGKYALIFIIAAIFLWNTKPLITGEIRTLFVPRKIPKDYLVVKDFILKQNNYFRILWVPTASRWSIYADNHPEVGAVGMIGSAWNSYIRDKVSNNVAEAELIAGLLTFSGSESLLNNSSIKYVIVPLDDKDNEDSFPNYGKSRQYYLDQLDKISWLHKINIGTKEVSIYENPGYKPHIYATQGEESIITAQKYKNVNYNLINPTKFTFSVRNTSGPFYLNFSESYHPQWKLRIGDFSWISALTTKNYFLPDRNHFQTDAALNSYFLDPKLICGQFSCRQNMDGSFDISGTLYFDPQGYLNFGLIISGATLTILLSCMLFIFGKYLYEKNK